MKICGVKKIYKTPEVAVFPAYGNSVLAASDLLKAYDAEVDDKDWFGGGL